MVTLEQIKEHVINGVGFGRTIRELDGWYWSNGISYAYDEDKDAWKPYIEKALARVDTDDYGGFYEYGEEPVKGREYWICESPFGNDISTGIIMHRENKDIVMYFQFER